MEQQEIVNLINNELQPLFPDSFVLATVSTFVGEPTICFRFASSKNWSNGIIQNDKAFSSTLIQKDGKKWAIDSDYFGMHRVVKFRKITADSEEQAARKLIAWFIKNRQAILDIPK